jgi:hypothetical protein
MRTVPATPLRRQGYHGGVNPTTALISTYLQKTTAAYWEAVEATIYGLPRADILWQDFSFALRQALLAVDVTAAERLRLRALGGQAMASHGTDLDHITHMSPWIEPHVEMTGARIIERARFVTEHEKRFYVEGAERIKATGTPLLPAKRLTQAYGMSQRAVAADAEQVVLADPVVGGHFPACRYNSRGDARVRETHHAMNGTIMARDWEGYAKCIPPAGFQCRCFVTMLSWRELQAVNLATADHKLKFKVRWSNQKAKKNFENGTFPDKGFVGPSLAATVVTPPVSGIRV